MATENPTPLDTTFGKVAQPRLVVIILCLVCLLFVGNLLLLDYLVVAVKNDVASLQTRLVQMSDNFKKLNSRLFLTPETPISGDNLEQITAALNSCPNTCVNLIFSATASGKPTSPLVAPVSSPPPSLPKAEYFVPLGSGSISPSNDWKDVDSAQATFDAGSYGDIKQAHFEVFLRTSAGEVSARLFDATTPAVFWSTEQTTSSTTSKFISTAITLSKGAKTYKVQMKSTISTGVLDQARVRIVTQ